MDDTPEQRPTNAELMAVLRRIEAALIPTPQRRDTLRESFFTGGAR